MRTHAADRPILSRTQDKFGRGTFAAHLAKALSEWDGQESIVVGLCGSWGSGKTSMKNLLIENIEKELSPEVRPDVLEFNPWAVSSQGGLLTRFYQEVGIKLGQPDRGLRSSELEKKFRAWASALKLAERGTVSIHRMLTMPLFVGALTFIGSGSIARASWLAPWLQAIGIIGVIAAGILRFSRTAADAAAEWFKFNAEHLRKPIEELKKELVSALRNRDRSLIVVLDDIDRLQAGDIRTLFQFVKACGDLPKISYLLLFQRDVVERSLQDAGNPDGAEFLKKIIQLEFDLPLASREQLDALLFERLDVILVDLPSSRFDHERWTNLYHGGLQQLFHTPRDINRFSATYEFQLEVLGGGKNPEVDPVDLLGIEAIRTFEPAIHVQLPALKKILTTSGVGNGSTNRDDVTRETLNNLVPKDPPGKRESLTEILQRLFPPIAWAFGGSTHSSESMAEWTQSYRVCSPEFFDRYFMLAVPHGDISKAEFDSLLAIVGDRDALVRALLSFHERGIIPVVVSRLHQFKSLLEVNAVAPFVTAFFDIGEFLPSESKTIRIGAFNEALFLLNWFISQETNTNRREEVLENAIDSTVGIAMPCSLVAWQKRSQDQGSETYIISENELGRFQAKCAEKISAAGSANLLSQNPHLGRLLNLWLDWTDGRVAREWVAGVVQSGGAFTILEALASVGLTQTFGDHFSRPLVQFQLQQIERFIPVGILKAGVDAIPQDGLTKRQELLLVAFEHTLSQSS